MFGWASFVSNPLLPTLYISFQTITSWLCMLEEIIIYKYITYKFTTQTIQTNYKRRKSWFSPKRKTKGDLQCDQKCKNCDWKIIEFSDSCFMICNKSRSFFFFKWLEGPRSNNDLAIIKINNDELLRGPEVTFRSLIFPMQISALWIWIISNTHAFYLRAFMPWFIIEVASQWLLMTGIARYDYFMGFGWVLLNKHAQQSKNGRLLTSAGFGARGKACLKNKLCRVPLSLL